MTRIRKAIGDNLKQARLEQAQLTSTVDADVTRLMRLRFTISNTGSRGTLFDTVIVPPHQAAILGVGATVRRPGVVRGAGEEVIGIRDLVHLSLSYDHRLVDGADAARYPLIRTPPDPRPHPVVTCTNQPKSQPSSPEVSSLAPAGIHGQEVFMQVRQGPPSRRAIFARLHNHPADFHSGHVYITAGVQLVERREHRLIGNGSDQANKVLPVRSGRKDALRGGQLIERARFGPAVDRTVPQAPQQHESRELRKVFHDLRLDQVDGIGHAEGAELGTQRLCGSLPWHVQAVHPFLPC